MIKNIKNWFRKSHPRELVVNDSLRIPLLDDDVFLVSYPKSGNTWVRFLIGNYITNGNMDFSNAHLLMPDVHFNPGQIKQLENRPRFIKSHFPFRTEYPNVIYIYRDGRDVAVSYYFFLIKMKALPIDIGFDEYLEKWFYSGKLPFGRWDEHVFSWMNSNNSNNVIFVKYEDLLLNALPMLEKMVRFSKLEFDNEKLQIAVEKASFDSMRKNENVKINDLKARGHDLMEGDFRIVRSGKSNAWREKFTPEQTERFGNEFSSALSFLNYSMK